MKSPISGYTAKCSHYRACARGLAPLYIIRQGGETESPTGGETVVRLTKRDGRGRPLVVVTATAYCHPDDHYCKATGRALALSRALEAVYAFGEAREVRVAAGLPAYLA